MSFNKTKTEEPKETKTNKQTSKQVTKDVEYNNTKYTEIWIDDKLIKRTRKEK